MSGRATEEDRGGEERPERARQQRQRIVSAAAELLTSGGRDAVSTRAVSAAAGVQAPALYRQFGDMQALLQAAAREVLAGYVRRKAKRRASGDPVEELRRGWDTHVAFGLANPAAYTLMYGDAAARSSDEVREGHDMLRALVARVAEEGRLRVSVDRAAELIHAGACGATLSLLAVAPDQRDPGLSGAMRDIVLASITGAPVAPSDAGPRRIAARAIALRAVLADDETLSPPERALLSEWLDRLAKAAR